MRPAKFRSVDLEKRAGNPDSIGWRKCDILLLASPFSLAALC